LIGDSATLSLDGLVLDLALDNFRGVGITQMLLKEHEPQSTVYGQDGGLLQAKLLYTPRFKWQCNFILPENKYDIFYTIWDRNNYLRRYYTHPRNFIRFDNKRISYEESGTASTSVAPGTTLVSLTNGVSYFASWYVNLKLPRRHYEYLGDPCNENRYYQVNCLLEYMARV
jgi:hypothetical protein